jgi:hypothetical protein
MCVFSIRFQSVDIGATCGYRVVPRLDESALRGLGVATSAQNNKRISCDWHAGDLDAFRDLVPLVYDELRRVAHNYLRNARPGHTLQRTALVHEAYLRLEKQGTAQFKNREHFLDLRAIDAADSRCAGLEFNREGIHGNR